MAHFLDDEEKMIDFMNLSKDEFLESYSYLTIGDWFDTYWCILGLAETVGKIERMNNTVREITGE